jgi:cytochrome c peroxidase
MASDILEVVEKLSGNQRYELLSEKAFGKPLDADVLIKSLAAYERTLIFGNSKYDQYLQGFVQLTDAEMEGMLLFEEIGCATCHSGVLFTSGAFENNGLLTTEDDPGRYRVTLNPDDHGKFKVPTLRNLALTAPYMHDGRFNLLEEVIEYYNKGGDGHPNQSDKIQPLHLSETEKQQLFAFLKSLTDAEFFEQ